MGIYLFIKKHDVKSFDYLLAISTDDVHLAKEDPIRVISGFKNFPDFFHYVLCFRNEDNKNSFDPESCVRKILFNRRDEQTTSLELNFDFLILMNVKSFKSETSTFVDPEVISIDLLITLENFQLIF